MIVTSQGIHSMTQHLPYRFHSDEFSVVSFCSDALSMLSGKEVNGTPLKLDGLLHLDSSANAALGVATRYREPVCFRASIRVKEESLLPVYWTVVPEPGGYDWFGFPAAIRDRIEGRLTELELLVASLTDMVFELDKDGIYINFWVKDPGVLFVEPSLFLGQDVRHVIHNYFEPLEHLLRPAYDEAVESRSIKIVEYVLPGTSQWYSCRYSPILNSESSLVGMIITIAEISAQKKLEFDLRESEQSYRDLFENANDIIYIIDTSANLRSMNRMAEKLLGYSEEEMTGKSSHLFFAPEKLPYAIEQGAVKIDGGTNLTVYESEFVSKNGTRIPVEVSSRIIIKNGQPDGIHVTARDMTNHKKAQSELANSEARFRFLSEYAHDLICLHRPNGDYIYVSPASRQLLGYEPEELTNRSPYDFFLPEDADTTVRDAHNHNSKGMSSHSVQYRFRKKDGSYIWLETVSKPIVEDGEVIYIQTNSRDITYRKMTEDQLVERDRLSSALAKASKLLLTSNSVEDGLRQCLQVLGDAVQAECLFVLQCIEGETKLFHIWCKSSPCTIMQKAHLFIGASALLSDEEKNTAGFVSEFHVATETNDTIRNWMEELGYKSLLVTPLVTSDGNWGGFGCGQKENARQWTKTTIDTLTTFASSLSAVIEKNIRDQQIRRSENLVQLEKEVLEMHTGSNASLQEIANHLLVGLETLGDSFHCAVLLCKSNLKEAVSLASPSLPAAFRDFVNNTPNDSIHTTCGRAVETRQQVFIEDISESDLAETTRQGAEMMGIKASWSIPIISSTNEVLGTFSVFFKDARSPRPEELTMINRANHILTMIIENKQAAEKLHMSNERYILATRASNEAIWDWDAIERVSFWGEGFNTLFGYPSQFYPGDTNNWEDKIHSDDRERVLKSIESVLTGNRQGLFIEEYRFRKADGTYALVIDKGYCMYNDQGKVIRMIGSCEDITERKRMEERLVQQEIHKQQQIAQAVVDVQESERAEIGKELHDNVNQLLTTAKLFLEVAQNEDGMSKQMIRRSSDTIMSAINEIRTISRSLMPASLNDLGLVSSINDLVENIELTRQLKVIFRHKGKLDSSLHPKQKLTLFRIIQEQVNNVIKHAKARKLEIDISYTNKFTRLEIKDDGQGFDLNEAKLKDGMGLSNIMSRAAIFNADVQVLTAPGEGCRLIIALPNKINQDT